MNFGDLSNAFGMGNYMDREAIPMRDNVTGARLEPNEAAELTEKGEKVYLDPKPNAVSMAMAAVRSESEYMGAFPVPHVEIKPGVYDYQRLLDENAALRKALKQISELGDVRADEASWIARAALK